MNMGFLKSAKDGFSGDTNHWTGTHNPVLSELIRKVNALPSDRVEFFTELLVMSHHAVERLVFPREGAAMLKVSIKSITRRQFLELYAVLLAFLMAKLAKGSPEIASNLKDDLLLIIDRAGTELAAKVFADITSAPANDFESTRLWKSVTNVLNTNDVGDDLQHSFLLYASLIEYLRIALAK